MSVCECACVSECVCVFACVCVCVETDTDSDRQQYWGMCDDVITIESLSCHYVIASSIIRQIKLMTETIILYCSVLRCIISPWIPPRTVPLNVKSQWDVQLRACRKVNELERKT